MIKAIQFFWRFLPYALEQFKTKACSKSAAALTYMTLFAIVPLMTVTFSMFSIFPLYQGMEQQLQDFIFQYLLPGTGLDVQKYLGEFSSQARHLSGWGVLMLVITAYLMLKNIEKTFNSIWGILEGRKGLSNFLLYWAVLSLGPILLMVGMGMSTYLISLKLFVKEYDSLGLMPWMLQFTPWVLTSAAFTLLFAAVPNCKVPLKHAFTGGVVTAICFELLKALFGLIVAKTSFSAIYGAFAFVPLFLLWVNLLWTIVLMGAMLVRALSTYKTAVIGHGYPDLVAALLILWEFQERLPRGESISDGQLLQVGVEAEQWQRIRDSLLRHNVIVVTAQGDYVLCRDLRWLTLRDLADMVEMKQQMPGVSDYLQQFTWFPGVAGRLLAIDQNIEEQFDVVIGDLFAVEPEPEPEYPDEGEGLEMLKEELEQADEDREELDHGDLAPDEGDELSDQSDGAATIQTIALDDQALPRGF